jgi:hypothetical protein
VQALREDPTLIKQGYVPRDAADKERVSEPATELSSKDSKDQEDSLEKGRLGAKKTLAKRNVALREFVSSPLYIYIYKYTLKRGTHASFS